MSKSELVTTKIFKRMFEGLVNEVQRTNKGIITELQMHVATFDKHREQIKILEKRVDNYQILLEGSRHDDS